RSLGTAGERSLKAIQAASRPASAGLQATDRAARDLRGGLRAVAGEVPAVQRLTRLLGTTALAGGMVALGRSALDVGRQFQAAMKRVEAVTNAPAAALERLADAARQTGASTAFTAQQAADAIEVLAKNGLDTEAILQGALRATVNLAGGLGSELAPSADLVTDIMQQFNLSAAELPEVADAVAGAALTSKFGFDDLRLAIGQAGGVVGQFGGDYREFLTALSATASGFASGSDAGTSFKNFLQRLTPQSKQAAAAMEELGLEFYAADGTMKSMVEIAAELQAATEGLSAEARNSSFQTIFGTDAIRTALLLADQGAEGLRDLGRALGEVSAEEQAQVRLEGLDGALKELTAAWEALQLTSAENGGLDLAEAAVTRLTEALRYLEENFAEVEEIAERVGQALVTFLVGRGITLAVAKAVAMRAAYIELAGAVTGVGTAASRAIGPMTRLGAAGRVLMGTLGGPLSLAITAASVAALAIDFDSASDAVERADAATAGATSALEAYREASRLAAEEQKKLGGEISAATREMLTQSEAELLRLIPQAERELQRARETFLSNGWGSGDARGVRETLEAPNAAAMKRVDLGFSTVEEELQGRGLNQYLFGLQEVFAAFERGEAPIADFLEELARLERIPPHFTEISAAMVEMLDAGETGTDAFDALSSEMIELARTAGLFERELAAIDAAQSRTERNQAIHELAGALSDASAAGLHLREELTEQQREVMGGIADTSAALEGLNEDYQANSDLAGELEGTRPFDDVGESAKEAAEQVARLSEAYETYRSAGSEGFWQTDRGAYPREELEVAKKGILDLIGFVEGTDKGRGYNETLGYGAFTGGPVNLVNMSLSRVRKLQDEMLRHPDNTYNSSAVGRYQIVGRTLQSLMDRLDLSGDELFSAELQDRLAMELVRGRMGQGKSGFYAEWEGFKKAGTPWRTIQEALGQDSIPAVDPEVEKAREDSQEKRAEARREEAETLARLVAIGDDQIAQLELEAELTGKNAEEQAYLTAMFEMLT
ncbi:phage tail protein, partial [Roseivivax marinus]